MPPFAPARFTTTNPRSARGDRRTRAADAERGDGRTTDTACGHRSRRARRPVLTAPEGFLEQRGNPKVVTSSEQSYDVGIQRRLWRVSEELTSVTYPSLCWPERGGWSPVCSFAFRLLRVWIVFRLLNVWVVFRLLNVWVVFRLPHVWVVLVEALISSGLRLLSGVHARLLSVPALPSPPPSPPLPGLLHTLNVAVDPALRQIRARVTRFVVATVSGIDDRTKNLICLVHQRVGQADITKHLRQREILGRHKISRDGPVLVVGSRDIGDVLGGHAAGSVVNIGGPWT